MPKINKSVILLSTHHHDEEIEYDARENKPEIIHFYNRNKGGVDAFDQLLENNTVRRKTNRWPKSIFYFMIDATVQNSFSATLFQIEKYVKKINDLKRLKKNFFVLKIKKKRLICN